MTRWLRAANGPDAAVLVDVQAHARAPAACRRGSRSADARPATAVSSVAVSADALQRVVEHPQLELALMRPARCDRSPRRRAAAPAARRCRPARQTCGRRWGEASRISMASPRQNRRRICPRRSPDRSAARARARPGSRRARTRPAPRGGRRTRRRGRRPVMSRSMRSSSAMPPSIPQPALGGGLRWRHARVPRLDLARPAHAAAQAGIEPLTIAPDVDEEAVIAAVEAAEGRTPRPRRARAAARPPQGGRGRRAARRRRAPTSTGSSSAATRCSSSTARSSASRTRPRTPPRAGARCAAAPGVLHSGHAVVPRRARRGPAGGACGGRGIRHLRR